MSSERIKMGKEKMSLRDKIDFEILSLGGDLTTLGGAALIASGRVKLGLFYLGLGVIGNLGAVLHQSEMKFERNEMPFYSRIKYSLIPPFKYIGREQLKRE